MCPVELQSCSGKHDRYTPEVEDKTLSQQDSHMPTKQMNTVGGERGLTPCMLTLV